MDMEESPTLIKGRQLQIIMGYTTIWHKHNVNHTCNLLVCISKVFAYLTSVNVSRNLSVLFRGLVG